MAWEYKREESTGFEPLPVGKYRIRIKSAEMAKSNAGNDMINLCFEVSGSRRLIFHNITLLKDRPDVTNRMLTAFFDSFKAIPDGSFDFAGWIGKVGACMTKQEEYNGKVNSKVHYFIAADKAGDIAPWVEPPEKDNAKSESSTGSNFEPVSDDVDIPFK